jgi:hypothetical protein
VNPPADPDHVMRRHLRFGWGALLVFVIVGLGLEALLALKNSAYVDVGNDTRRLMWRLGHAHGTGLALVNIAYGLTVKSLPGAADLLASACLLTALFLVPLGFLGGGFLVQGGDPGLFVFAVPPGAVALIVGVARIARAVSRS